MKQFIEFKLSYTSDVKYLKVKLFFKNKELGFCLYEAIETSLGGFYLSYKLTHLYDFANYLSLTRKEVKNLASEHLISKDYVLL